MTHPPAIADWTKRRERFAQAVWERATDDMVSADLGHWWTANLMAADRGGVELTFLDPRGCDFGEPAYFDSYEAAMNAMPELAARRIGEHGELIGEPLHEDPAS